MVAFAYFYAPTGTKAPDEPRCPSMNPSGEMSARDGRVVSNITTGHDAP